MLTEFFYLGEAVGNCLDDCQCSCMQVGATQADTATTDAGNLQHNSGTRAHPILMFALSAYIFPTMTHMDADLTVGTTQYDTVYFGPAPEGTEWVIFGIQIDASSMASGIYNWQLDLTLYRDGYSPFTPSYSSIVGSTPLQPLEIVNRDESQYGAGWSNSNDQRLVIQDDVSGQPDGVALVTGNNDITFFYDPTDGVYTRQGSPSNFSELEKDDNGTEEDATDDTYILTDPDGLVRTFDDNGLLQTVVDRNGNPLATYTYGTAGDWDKIVDIEDVSGRHAYFEYVSGLLVSVTDFDGTSGEQTTEYVYSGDELIQMIAPDPDGEGPLSSPVTTYHYNGNGLLDSIIDPRGLETTIAYDDTRRVSSITERCGGVVNITSLQSLVTVFDFDANGPDEEDWAPLVAYHDPHRQYQVYGGGYSLDDLSDLFDEGGAYETRNVFGEQSKIVRDRFGGMSYRQDAAGTVTSIQRYSNGLPYLVTQRDPNNPAGTLTTTYSYDSSGRVTYASYPIGFESITYGPFSQVSDYTDPSGTSVYDIDGDNGNVLSMTQGDGTSVAATTYYTYTDISDGTLLGLVETVTDPNGNVTFYTYNSQGLVETITSALGTDDQTTVEYEYDSRDRVSATIDGLGRRTDFTYDNLDRLIQTTEPDPDGNGPQARPVWQFRYDQIGNQTHVTDPLGRVTETVYDSRGRVFQVIQPVADPEATPYSDIEEHGEAIDENGNWDPISPGGTISGNQYATDGAGGDITFKYDGLDDDKKYRVMVRWVAGSPGEYDKGAVFQVFSGTSGTAGTPLLSRTTNLNHAPEGLPDGSGRMWLTLGAFSPEDDELYVFLEGDDKLAIDAVWLVEVGPVSQTEFDCNNNLTTSIDALGNATTYEYDELNRLIERTDADPGTGSPVTRYFYNSLGWLTSMIDAEDNGTIHQYDSMGRQIKQLNVLGDGLTGTYVDGSGTTVQIDSQVNFDTVSSDLNGYSSVVWTGAIYLDDPGEVTFYLENTDYTHLYIDDIATAVVDNYNYSSSMVEESGSLQLSAGWHTIRITFDDAYPSGDNGLVVRYSSAEISKDLIPASAFGTTQTTSTASYDSAGRVLTSHDAMGRGMRYEYDALDRVTYARTQGNNGSYSYDSGPYNYNTYDGAGNLLATTNALGERTLYAHDALNRQTQVMQPDADDTTDYDLLDEDQLNPTTDLTGSWSGSPTSNSSAYNSDLLEATSTGASATFTFDSLDNDKTYAVLVHWAGDSTDPDAYDADALFKVYAGTSPTNVVHQSQQNLNLPLQGVSSTYYSSTTWKVLGAFHPLSGELSLVISDDNNNGYLAIDAVHVLEVGGATTYAYDDASQLSTLTDPVGNTTSWVYDGLGRTVEETNELNATRYFQYDAVGNATRMIDRNGRISRYEYDNLNRQTTEIWQDDGVGDKVKGRYVFYNNSGYDGTSDDDAIAPDKVALLPGETATAANVTNYSLGLNGIMIDIVEVGTLSASDFIFKAGTASDPSSWSTVNGANVSISVREDEGKDGSDRVTILFNNYEVYDEWLQVTVKANANTGLDSEDVFYFANVVGDYDYSYDADGADFVVWQTFSGTVTITSGPDGDRDGDVDGADFVIWQSATGDLPPITAPADTERTIGYQYDLLGRLAGVTDRDGSNSPAGADYTYVYDNLSRVYSVEQSLVGLTPDIVQYHAYDDMSRRTIQATTIGGTFDVWHAYAYDPVGRLSRLDQYGLGGNTVAEKRADFTYNLAGQFSTIDRYANYAGTNLVATSTYGYDDAGRLGSLLHQRNNGSGLTDVAGYGWTWDNANRITQFTNSVSPDEDVTYSYDNAGQLVGADHASLTDESYTYDDNGNRIDVENGSVNTTYTTGISNRLEDDGTFTYEYDGEGNLIRRVDAPNDFYIAYEWDHRNRLISVSEYADSHLSQRVTYIYDAFDRLIGKQVDENGDTDIDRTEAYVYDGDQIVLRFADTDDVALAAGDLTNRYLWAPGVDHLLAQENVTSLGSAGTVDWALGDHQNTIRDWVQFDGSETDLLDHAEYDSFGNRLDSPTVDSVFGWTGRIRDADTGLQWNGSTQGGGRWYDSSIGRWISEDSIGFAGDPSNIYRYVGNAATIYVDPSGLHFPTNVPNPSGNPQLPWGPKPPQTDPDQLPPNGPNVTENPDGRICDDGRPTNWVVERDILGNPYNKYSPRPLVPPRGPNDGPSVGVATPQPQSLEQIYTNLTGKRPEDDPIAWTNFKFENAGRYLQYWQAVNGFYGFRGLQNARNSYRPPSQTPGWNFNPHRWNMPNSNGGWANGQRPSRGGR